MHEQSHLSKYTTSYPIVEIPVGFKSIQAPTSPGALPLALRRLPVVARQLIAAKATIAGLLDQPLSDDVNPYALNKWLYHQDQTQALLNGDLDQVRPVTVELIPTNECNFRCAACPYKQTFSGISRGSKV